MTRPFPQTSLLSQPAADQEAGKDDSASL